MHFWIDKRSQSCGFGRSRVAASLSGGSGIGFGHHPRRLGGKQMMGGLPIHHRYPPVEYRSQLAASSSSSSSSAAAAAAAAAANRNQHSAPNNHHSTTAHQRSDSRQTRGTSSQQQRPAHAVDAAATSSGGASDLHRFQHIQNILFQRTASATTDTTNAAHRPAHGMEPSGVVVAVPTPHRPANDTNASVHQYRQMPQQQQQSGDCPLSMGYFGSTTIDLELGALGTGSSSLLVRPPPAGDLTPLPLQHQQLYHHNNPYQSSSASHHSTATQQAAIERQHIQAMNNARFATHTAYEQSTATTALGNGGGAAVAAAAVTNSNIEAQLLPGHLKCGMYASLVLTTVFVAGAKLLLLTLDQPGFQGTGLEALIFVTFAALMAIGAYRTVSLCQRAPGADRRQRPAVHELDVSSGGGSGGGGASDQPSSTVIIPLTTMTVVGTAAGVQQPPQQQQHVGPVAVDGSERQLQEAAVIALAAHPPPPYHIAILLPDHSVDDKDEPTGAANGGGSGAVGRRGDDIDDDDEESPPPSYDKLME